MVSKITKIRQWDIKYLLKVFIKYDCKKQKIFDVIVMDKISVMQRKLVEK